MGTDKRKRKSNPVPTPETVKQRRVDDELPSWQDHSGYTVLKLENQQSVLFVGEATLQVLHGAVRVSGKLISPDSPPVVLSTGGRFSLAITITADAPVFQVPMAASPTVEVSLQSRAPLQRPQPLQPLQPPLQQQLQAGPSAGARGATGSGAGQGTSASLGPISGLAPAAACTFSLHKATDPRAPPSLAVSRGWAQALDELCGCAAAGVPLVLAVLGAKGMGKSSFCRLAANRLLDEAPVVAFLDSDVGQPECTPPGLLALHLLEPGRPLLGPPHAHSMQPWASRFVGDTSPQHDPQLYLSAVQALYGSYWEWAQAVVARAGSWPPLVVNTHGWVKGLGFDLLTQLLRLVAPSHVVQIRGGHDKKNLPRGAFWCDPRDPLAAAPPSALMTLESLAEGGPPGGPGGGAGAGGTRPTSSGGGGPAGSGEREASGSGRQRGGGGGSAAGPGSGAPISVSLRSLKPVESRALAWHAWAKRVVGFEPAWGSYESDDFWTNAGALAAHPPWRVSLDDLHVQLLAGSLPYSQLGRVLNGAVVGLLATSPPPPAGSGGAVAATMMDARARGNLSAAGSSRQPGESLVKKAGRAGGVAAAPPAPPHCATDTAAAAAATAGAPYYPPGRISYFGASSIPPPLLPCVGLGVVRAVDMTQRVAYLLTDVGPEVLDCVGALVVGRLELPGSLLVGGEVASPYQQLFGLSAEATGAGSAKARKNLSRSSLVELAG